MRSFTRSSVVALLVAGVLCGSTRAEAQPVKKSLTLEAIFDTGLSEPEPSTLRWAPDGRLVYFFKAGADPSEEAVEDESSSDESKTKGTRNLWAMDVATGAKEILVPADDVRRWAPTA
ncbi:MAG: hypothetical protein AAF657_32590, partial [Acidobacteriota bacterium]